VYEFHVLGSNGIDGISNNKKRTWADDGSDNGDSDVGSEQDDNEDEMR
jgi:hypothetical protein